MMLFILDLSKSCEMEVYRAKQNRMFEWKLLYGLLTDPMMTVNLWSSYNPHIITPLWLVFILQYSSRPHQLTLITRFYTEMY